MCERHPSASKDATMGFDARTGRIGDVVSAGIADPLSLTSGVLARAVSAAATMLRIEALICR
jgi:chaperonin GroEL (HSP60 family)